MNEQPQPDSKPAAPPKRKRGRPPIGDRPLTLAERQRRARIVKRQAGVRHFLVELGGDNLQFLEEIADLTQVSRVGALRFIVDMGLHQIRSVMEQARRMGEAGETEDGATKAICRALGIDHEPTGDDTAI